MREGIPRIWWEKELPGLGDPLTGSSPHSCGITQPALHAVWMLGIRRCEEKREKWQSVPSWNENLIQEINVDHTDGTKNVQDVQL